MFRYVAIGIIVSAILIILFIKFQEDILVQQELAHHRETNRCKKGSKYIPKKIFQLVPNKDKIHPDLQENIKRIKKLNPDWEYKLLDDKDMITYLKKNYHPMFLQYYLSINPQYGAARADFFRYLLMYKEGGVYLDIKSSMTIPLNEIINENDRYILCHWSTKYQQEYLNNYLGEFQQWNIICSPKHPFLKDVINLVIQNMDEYNFHRDGGGRLAVLKLTGPIAYTRAITPLLPYYDHREVNNHEYIGLEYSCVQNPLKFFAHAKLIGKTHYSDLKSPIIIK